MEDFYYAGGLPAVLEQIRDLLHLDVPTVTGRTVGENLDAAATEIIDEGVIRPRSDPLDAGGSLVVLRGNLCPDGAVMKISAADPRLLAHEGRAIVFEDIHDLAARVDDPDLDIDADSVMVLRNAGPVGAPGMPEWGHLPIPAKLLKQGVADLLRISDARMSGTSYGAVVLHVAPESAVGGPLALIRDRGPDPPRRRGALARDAGRRRRARPAPRRMDATAAQGRARLPPSVRGPRAAGQRGLRPRLPARALTGGQRRRDLSLVDHGPQHSEGGGRGLGDRRVLVAVAAADTDRADDHAVALERDAAGEDHDAALV